MVNLLRTGAVIQLAAAGVLLILGLIFGGKASFYWVFASLFICIAGLGLTQPNAATIALAFQKKSVQAWQVHYKAHCSFR